MEGVPRAIGPALSRTTGRGGSPELVGGVGQAKHLSEGECPAQLWGDPARCCGFRGEAGRQVQDLRQALCLQILLSTPALPQRQGGMVPSWKFHSNCTGQYQPSLKQVHQSKGGALVLEVPGE